MAKRLYFYIAATIAALVVAYVTGRLFYTRGLFEPYCVYSFESYRGWVRTSFTLDSLEWLGIAVLFSTVVYLPLYTYLKRLYEADTLTARMVMYLPALDFENKVLRFLCYRLSYIL